MTETARVVIVGAGFAGLSAVGQLRKAGLHVTVIDKHLYSTFQPLLYQVATGGLNPGDVAYPVGGFTVRRSARYMRGELVGVDRAARIALLEDGREIGYDYLILATGVSANYFGVKGAAENTFGLYSRTDAIVLRDHIMTGFELLSADPDGTREFAVTVVGGGATGVELAGTLGELRNDVLRATFPDGDPQRVHVRLVGERRRRRSRAELYRDLLALAHTQRRRLADDLPVTTEYSTRSAAAPSETGRASISSIPPPFGSLAVRTPALASPEVTRLFRAIVENLRDEQDEETRVRIELALSAMELRIKQELSHPNEAADTLRA